MSLFGGKEFQVEGIVSIEFLKWEFFGYDRRYRRRFMWLEYIEKGEKWQKKIFLRNIDLEIL